MSIDSVRARIADLQAQIQELAAPQSPTPQVIGPSTTRAARLPIAANESLTVAPFPVALANAMGSAVIRPTGSPFTSHIEELIAKHSVANGLSPELVRAVIRAESDGDPTSTSSKGAKGLMQLMPDELKEYGVTDPFDPEQSISAGSRQLAAKLKLFNNDLSLALAAYNAGSGAVRRYGGIPPYTETHRYVSRILKEIGQVR